MDSVELQQKITEKKNWLRNNVVIDLSNHLIVNPNEAVDAIKWIELYGAAMNIARGFDRE